MDGLEVIEPADGYQVALAFEIVLACKLNTACADICGLVIRSGVRARWCHPAWSSTGWMMLVVLQPPLQWDGDAMRPGFHSS